MPLLTLSQIAKSYDEERPLLQDVSLVVEPQDHIGLIGPNGAGKSTLLKIMAGVEVADAGERVVQRELKIGYLEQEPQFPADCSVEDAVRQGLEGREQICVELDKIYAAWAQPDLSPEQSATLARRQEELQHQLDKLGGHDVEHQVAAAMDGVGLQNPHALCGTLSGGEARRVALAKLLVGLPDLLLLDEPTNHLDAFVIAWLEKQLAALKIPLVLVTHDRFLLDRVANRIVEIDRGHAFSYPGNYGVYLQRRAQRLAQEEKAEQHRLQLLKRETEWMRAGVLARSTKAKARIDRYHQLANAEALGPAEELEMVIPPGPRLGTRVLDLQQVSFSYGQKKILQEFDLHIENGMRLGIVGPNGVGKTTLLRILLGQLQPEQGIVQIGETVRFGSIEQKREDLDPEATVVEEIAGDSEHVEMGKRKLHVASFLDRFLFPGNRKFVKIQSLSGGERGRVLLAKLLLQDCNVLVLDEPTNDLDLNTLRALEEALCAFSGCVLLVSHDRWFLDRVATHVLLLDGKGGAFLHHGSASELLERQEKPASTPQKAKPKKTAVGKTAPPNAKLSNKEKRELDALWQRIEELETELSQLDEQLAKPETYSQEGDLVASLQQQRKTVATQLEKDFQRWEELASRVEESR